MKTLAVIMWVAAAVLNRAQDSVATQLQKGLFEEEANHNLAAAIQQYQAIIKSSDDQRRLVATALFRLGECYRKLGKTNEAAQIFNRLVRDFSDQSQIVEQASVRLPAKPAEKTDSVPPESSDLSTIVRTMVDANVTVIESDAIQSRIDRTLASELLWILPTVASLNENDRETIQEKLRLQQEYAAKELDYALEHPEIQRMVALMNLVDKQYNNAVGNGQRYHRNQIHSANQVVKLQEHLLSVRVLTPVQIATARAVALSEKLAVLRSEEERLRQLIASGEKGEFEGDDLLTWLVGEKQKVERERAAKTVDRADEHPEIRALDASIKAIQKQIEEKREGMLAGYKMLLAAKERSEKWIVSELEKANAQSQIPARVRVQEGGDDRLAQFENLFKNSPDLLNAAAATNTLSFLQNAASTGDLPLLDYLINRGAEIERQNSEGLTPLHLAVRSGHKKAAERLLEAGSEVNTRDRRGNTPLHTASASGFTELAEVLLARGADVNAQNRIVSTSESGGGTPLHLAASAGQLSTIKLLVAKNAKIDAAVPQGNTPLHTAIEARRGDAVRLLLELGANPNILASVRDPNDRVFEITPLILAVERAPDLVEPLLDKGADPNKGLASYGRTALHLAVKTKNLAAVSQLLAHGANPNVRDEANLSPLDYACGATIPGPIANQGDQYATSVEAVRVLLENKADPNAADSKGSTALTYALYRPEIVRLLIEHGADPRRVALIGYPGKTLADLEAGAPRETIELLRKGASTNSGAQKP